MRRKWIVLLFVLTGCLHAFDLEVNEPVFNPGDTVTTVFSLGRPPG